MTITDVDHIMVELARDYAKQLEKAMALRNPMLAGTTAQRAWLEQDAPRRGCRAIVAEPTTAVTGPGPRHTGLRRYDARLQIGEWHVWVELKASGYTKQAQQVAQLIGFVEGCAGLGMKALYYKIVGTPREIRRWTREPARKQAPSLPIIFKY